MKERLSSCCRLCKDKKRESFRVEAMSVPYLSRPRDGRLTWGVGSQDTCLLNLVQP